MEPDVVCIGRTTFVIILSFRSCMANLDCCQIDLVMSDNGVIGGACSWSYLKVHGNWNGIRYG